MEYNNLFLIMVIIGCIFICVAIILGKLFKVTSLIDELSGRKARRQIKQLRRMNATSGMLDTMSTGDVYKTLSKTIATGENAQAVKEYQKRKEEDMAKSREAVSGEMLEGRREGTGSLRKSRHTGHIGKTDDVSSASRSRVIKEKEDAVVRVPKRPKHVEDYESFDGHRSGDDVSFDNDIFGNSFDTAEATKEFVPDFEVVDEQPPEVNFDSEIDSSATGYISGNLDGADSELTVFADESELSRIAGRSGGGTRNLTRFVKILEEQSSLV